MPTMVEALNAAGIAALGLTDLFSGPDAATLEHRCDYATNGLHLRNM
jgi:hypothetical protein